MTGRRLVWVLCPLLGIALVLEGDRATRLWRASRAAAVVKDITIAASERGRLSRRLLEHNLELLRLTEPLAPVEVALPIARGGQYLLLDRPRAAIRAYRHALEIEPRGEVWAHLGRAYLKLGDRVAAEHAFGLAMILDHTQRKRVRGFVSPENTRRSSVRQDPGAGTTKDPAADDAGEDDGGEDDAGADDAGADDAAGNGT